MLLPELLGILQASISKVDIEYIRRQDTSSEHLLCGRKLVVDECEGCMNVGDVGLHRPKQVPSNTQNDSLHQNTMKEYSDQVWNSE